MSETLPAHVLMVGHFFCANVGIVRPDALAPSEVISLYAPSLHPLAGADPGEANRPVSSTLRFGGPARKVTLL